MDAHDTDTTFINQHGSSTHWCADQEYHDEVAVVNTLSISNISLHYYIIHLLQLPRIKITTYVSQTIPLATEITKDDTRLWLFNSFPEYYCPCNKQNTHYQSHPLFSTKRQAHVVYSCMIAHFQV